MHSATARRVWSHLFIVPGGLLAFWGLLTLLYLQFFRVPTRTSGSDPQLACDFGQVLRGGTCTDPTWIMVLMMVLGGMMIVLGLALFRPRAQKPEDRLRVGAGTRLTLSILASLFAVPLLYGLSAIGRAGDAATEEWIRFGASAYGALPILFGAAAGGLVAFTSALAVHMLHESLRRRYLAARILEAPPKRPEATPPVEPWHHEGRDRGALPRSGFRWDTY